MLLWKTASAFLIWMILNITLSFLNKILFSEKQFVFPVLIIILGTVSTGIGTALLLYCGFERFQLDASRAYWKPLLALALIHGVDVGLENFSIVYISISLNQIIKSTLPALTLLFSWAFERKHYSLPLVLATAITVCGAMLAVFNNPQAQEQGGYGVIAAVLSTVAAAIATLLIGQLLEHINATTIAFMSAWPSAAVLLPAFFMYEFPTLYAPAHTGARHTFKNRGIETMLAATCCVALLYNLSRLFLIKLTEAHYSVVAGNVKVGVIVICSMLYFHDHKNFTARNWAGIVLTLIGFTVYSWFKFQQEKRRTT